MQHDPTLDLARPREGKVDVWVRLVVVAALVCTLAVLISAPRVIWQRDAETIGIPRFWFHNALALGAATLLALACVVPARGSQFVRLALVLPVIQVLGMLAAWAAWSFLKHRMPSAQDSTPLLEKVPVHIVLPWIAFAIGGGGWLVARKRRRETLHAIVMLALVNLLLLGLWLPLASNVWNGHGWRAWGETEHALDTPNGMIVFVVVPPFVGALAFTATALRWPQIWRRNSGVVIALLLLTLLVGVAIRREVSEIGAFIYLSELRPRDHGVRARRGGFDHSARHHHVDRPCARTCPARATRCPRRHDRQHAPDRDARADELAAGSAPGVRCVRRRDAVR